jgi:hypothetical protein
MFSATVSKCYPTTGSYKIVLDDSESDEEYGAIPLLPYKSTDGMSAVRFIYNVGSRVLVTKTESGEHVILGCLPITTERPDSDGNVATSESNLEISKASTAMSAVVQGSLFSSFGEDSYTTFEDSDLLPGDLSLSSPGGASLKVMRGGVTSLGSENSNISTNMSDSSVRIDCKRHTVRTGMGVLTIEDSPGGSYFMQFLGNCNSRAKNPNIDVSITSNGGKPTLNLSLGSYGVKIDSSGDITLRGSRVLWDNGEEIAELSKEKSILESIFGSDTAETSASSSGTSGGSFKTLGNSKTSVGGESHDTAGDLRSITTMGPSPTKKPTVAILPDTVNARVDTVASGSMSTKIGSPASGGGSFHLDTFSGDIKLSTNTGASPMVGGTVGLSSTAQFSKTGGAFGVVLDSPRTVVGGGSGLNTPGVPALQAGFAPIPGGLNATMSGACKFEALFTYLKALHTQLDTHTHALGPMIVHGPPILPSPIGPPIGNTLGGFTLPPFVPFTPTLSALALRIESQSLWLMGT